ncbi:hypothetical protein ULMS_03430 [Patiriisocius marinistellae]|uniref:Polymer-forming cytoskeletal protein n=1 Tax=Patiriisocius marinistellae TaxID=2494560 RepID=A0A5J4FXT5_9FLAO|nr:polymer-forming cytoskeletal protein [Patiriisocius marinistellae]GEQ84835.1 hypothetical protein ULMS_03430 [Patiriisocius marinistellae]
MLSDKKNRKPSNVSTEPGANQNRINEGTSITGDIESTGFFRIDGIIKGNVNTPSKVVLGKKGVITGTLNCEQADIEGTFEGTLTVANLLTLRSSAKIIGDVIVGKLAVEPGAEMNATCKMGNGVKSLNNDGKSKKEERIA